MRYLIMPDVHGRLFWKESIERHKKEIYEDGTMKVVFLGDYLDPYEFELRGSVGSIRAAVERFIEIVDLHLQEPDKIILLLGNHDMHYFSDIYRENIYLFRYCAAYARQIEKIMRLKLIQWKLAYKIDDILVGGRPVLLTHAGVLKSWTLRHWKDKGFDGKVPDEKFLNSLLETDNGILTLLDRSFYRGGDYRTGSLIWADANEFYNETMGSAADETAYHRQVYQIFGHTLTFPEKFSQIESIDSYYISDEFAMIDARRAFILDENGKLSEDVPV